MFVCWKPTCLRGPQRALKSVRRDCVRSGVDWVFGNLELVEKLYPEAEEIGASVRDLPGLK